MANNNELQKEQVAERVAMGAFGVALTAGVVALGAAMMTDEKTRTRLADNARNVIKGLRQMVLSVGEEGQETFKALKDTQKD